MSCIILSDLTFFSNIKFNVFNVFQRLVVPQTVLPFIPQFNSCSCYQEIGQPGKNNTARYQNVAFKILVQDMFSTLIFASCIDIKHVLAKHRIVLYSFICNNEFTECVREQITCTKTYIKQYQPKIISIFTPLTTYQCNFSVNFKIIIPATFSLKITSKIVKYSCSVVIVGCTSRWCQDKSS